MDSFTPPSADHFPSEFFIDQTTVELKLSRVKVNKAPGPDGVPNWMLRDFYTELSAPICTIFNAFFGEGFVPLHWKEAIYRSLKLTRLRSDLRPISLIPTLVQLIESIVG